MMDISKPRYFYAHFQGKPLLIKRKDGKEWVGFVTGMTDYDNSDPGYPEPRALIFTQVRWLKGYYRNIPFFRGRKKVLRYGEIAEIHELKPYS